ncbi:MAG: TonB-dependent receptor, partial [Acidobacteriaceae bacterium]
GTSERLLGAHRSRQDEMAQWFDTSVYCRAGTPGCTPGGGPSGLDGLVRAGSLTGPGYKNVDASLFRDFTIRERIKFQFRGEATNVFNFVNLNNPGSNLSSTSSFGQISGAGGMRVLQLGGRLVF